jgi:outer membrane protein assembly factor BamB
MNMQDVAMTTKKTKTSNARIVREYGPFGPGGVHGVTFDGKLVWFAREGELVAFDPESGAVVRKIEVPGAAAGTAFDGENLYQLAGSEIVVVRPSDGAILRRLPAPGKNGQDSGMAWGDGFLWVGQWKEGKINKVDPKTGAVVNTFSSDRWVTGVSCIDGALWHGTTTPEGGRAELRKLAADGTVEEALVLPEGIGVSGLERTRGDRFFCGGGTSGKVRVVER